MRTIRIILSLIVSLCLGGVICMVLVSTGVLKFQTRKEKPKIASPTKKVISRMTSQAGISEKTKQDLSIENDSKSITTSSIDPKVASEHPDPAVWPVSGKDKSIDKNYIQVRAVSFLTSANENESKDIEEQFGAFLKNELQLKPDDVQRLVHMSFWKNFITLEKQWYKEEWSLLEAEFKREMELKKAGFKAMGITLMENEISEAEIYLYNLYHRLMTTAQEGDKT